VTLLPAVRKLLALSFRLLLRFEFECQLVDLAGELEWRIVAIFQQRDPGTGVLADVERFILWKRDGCGVVHGIPDHFLAIYGQHTCSSFAQAWTIGLEVEDDGVLAGTQLRAFREAREVAEVRAAPESRAESVPRGMSAFGGKADMIIGTCPLSWSLLGVNRFLPQRAGLQGCKSVAQRNIRNPHQAAERFVQF
jgi:hypothetical protein